MSLNDYHFVSHWRVYGSVEEVSSIIIANGQELPLWWPSSYFDAEELKHGDETGLGHVFTVRARGWLPYSLELKFTALEIERPNHAIVGVTGDLTGTGEWTFEQDGDMVNVTFDWLVTMVRPSLRRLAPVLRPLFMWNHDWIMVQGERSLALEVLRRSTPPEDRAAIPPPPGPAKLPLKQVAIANMVGITAAAALFLRLRKR